MSDKPITGGCACGAVRYEVTGTPDEVGYCHCRMCQKHLGNLFGTFAIFRRDAFKFTKANRSSIAHQTRRSAVSALNAERR